MKILYNIYLVIPKKKIKYFFLLIILTFFSTILEIFGIGIIYPLLKLINNDLSQVAISSTPLEYLNRITLFLKNSSYSNKEIIIIYISSIIILFFLKFTLQLILLFLFARFLGDLFSEISNKFYNYYLERPLSYSVTQNSAKLINTILNKLSSVINDSLNPLIITISEFFILFLLLFSLIIINIKTFYLILILILFLLILFTFVKKISYILGKKRFFHFSKVIQLLQEGFSGLTEIKLFKIENKFLKKFNYHNSQRIDAEKNFIFINNSQRIILETFFILGFFFYLLFFALNSQIDTEFLALIALYLTILIRCLPSMHRIIFNYTRIVNAESATRFVVSQIKLINNTSKIDNHKKNRIFKHIIIKNIFFKYPKRAKYLFKNINLKIIKGDIIGISGKSGCGKTTFLKIILGLVDPVRGKVIFNSKNIKPNLDNLYSLTSYQSQNSYLINNTVRENITLGSKKKFNKFDYLNSIKLSDSVDLINRLPRKDNTIVGEKGLILSQGQRQKICLARIFYLRPKFIILDEATSALDNISEKIILENLLSINKKFKVTIIIVSHRETTLKICNKIINIEKYT